MKRIVLFRFHHQFAVCKNHLEILRHFNPGVKIYGLYGGSEDHFQKAKKLQLDHIWRIPLDDWAWKWKHGDLCARWWFKEAGKKFKFDMVHVVEWDLLLLDTLENLFGHIRSGVALTDLGPLSRLDRSGWWTGDGRQGRWEWKQLKKHVEKKYDWESKPLWGIFPGTSFSREFLERYAEEEPFSCCNDEVRVPLFAQAFGMKVGDTKLGNRFFNSMKKVITPKVVYENYKKGVKSFHPVRETLSLKDLHIKK